MIGKIILNYSILQKLGEGGMGAVYLGKHNTLDRKVAIKVLLPELANNQQIRERFINEAKTLSKLNHQNIVTLFDFTESDGNLFLIMEYIDGIPLDELIEKRTGAISEARCTKIFEKVLDGFSYAHQNGIIHRDIKPSNIILQSNDVPKILDFGIAKIIEGNAKLTKTGTRIGSVMYMSPEQILGNEVDFRSDIYSLGVTLFELLSGRAPYNSDTDSEFTIQTKIVQEPFPSVKFFNSSVPEKFDNIISRATSKNPLHRYSNCEEFKEDLNSGISNISSKKTVISTPILNTSVYQVRSKNKSKIIIFSAIILATVLAFVLYTIISKEDKIDVTTSKVQDNKITENSNQFKNNEEEAIKDKLLNWLSANEQKNSSISNYYSSFVSYYTLGNVSVNKVVSDKNNFFNKWDKIVLTPENINISIENNGKYVCVFDKTFRTENLNGKYYEGKVKSRIIFEKVNNEWLISNETDDKIYWTNKN